ncbi:MAG TPA: di-trans,poly-cis-decaprenylcistransferase [Candidatus Fournierella merdavium]|uniref:polyprenyl diphosphate synthase n=1 Tax=Candidatus Allofournierella merdavium TaxID=2838593 RepID=UPI001FA3907B|nr:di-trans,poly-cis-decaprenylcistransferase [Candidatus Fournierella merdavium]
MQQSIQELAKGLSIGIIMDGNGRWAKRRGLPRTAGHKKGAEVFQDITRYCNQLEVASVTFYAFSTENWRRPQDEVSAIMKLFGEYLIKAFDYQKENNRVVFLGERSVLEPKHQKLMNEIEEKTAGNTGMTLNIAVNYGGRPEIVRAAQQLAQLVKEGKLEPQDITEAMMSDHMYTRGQKDPDFILRPSGEKRLSNFMLWQAAYAELVEMDVLWPDFTRSDLDAAILEFCHRNRRFGGI